jgi:hypothetical protein
VNVTELSQVVVGQLGTGEQLVLWALRQRRAGMGATTPQLVQGFRLACGLAGVEPALASFERLFDALQCHGRCSLCPLRCAVVSDDEVTCIGLIAAAQRGLRSQQAKYAMALVGMDRAAELASLASRLAEILTGAGHVLSPPAPTAHTTLH